MTVMTTNRVPPKQRHNRHYRHFRKDFNYEKIIDCLREHLKLPLLLGKGDGYMANANAEELLQFLSASGRIDLDSAEEEMRKSKTEEILKAHPYKIYQGSDGKWYTHVRDESKNENRRKIVRNSKEELHLELYRHYSGIREAEILERITMEQLFPKWIEHKALHTTAVSSYIPRIKSDWKRYYEGTKIVKVPIVGLNKLILDDWVHALIKETEMTHHQYSNFTIIIHQLLDYAVDLEIIDSNPYYKVKVDTRRVLFPDRKKHSETEVYSKDELDGLKELAWQDYNSRVKRFQLAPLAVLFQFVTGLRIGEVCVVRYEDIEGDVLNVCRMIRRDSKEIVNHTKGGSSNRKVVLVSEAKQIIEKCRERQQELGVEDDGYLFSINGEPCSYYAISDLYRKYCDKLGIVKKSSHKARKSFISTLLDGNVNLNTVKEMAGHADETTTLANYYFDRNYNKTKEAMEMAMSG